MFDTKFANRVGIYLIKFYINGYVTPVIVDDLVPVKVGNYTEEATAFARRNDGILWPSLLEKAWAKLHGTYARAEAGFSSFALSHLSGVPCKEFNHDKITDLDKWWESFKSQERRNYICMSASRVGCGQGIIQNHAYSLLGHAEVGANGKVVRLMKMRNPWGRGEWTGDWSDNSP